MTDLRSSRSARIKGPHVWSCGTARSPRHRIQVAIRRLCEILAAGAVEGVDLRTDRAHAQRVTGTAKARGKESVSLSWLLYG